MLWMLEVWSRFIVRLYGGLKGVPDLKDAWFVASPQVYRGIIVSVHAFPVSDKGWAVFGLAAVYAIFALALVEALPMADGYLSWLTYILLLLPAWFASLRFGATKTYWTTSEKVMELTGWRKW